MVPKGELRPLLIVRTVDGIHSVMVGYIGKRLSEEVKTRSLEDEQNINLFKVKRH